MKTFTNMKVKAKLLTGFIIMALIVAIVGIVGIANIKSLDQSDTALYENMTVPLDQVGTISTAYQRLRVNLRDMIIANDPQTIQENGDKIAERKAEIDTVAAEFEKTIISDDMKTAFNEFTESRKVYSQYLSEVMALATQNQDAEAILQMAETSPAGVAARAEQDAIAKLATMKLADAEKTSAANSVQANSVVVTMIIAITIAMIIAIVIGFFLGNIISKPLKKAALMLKEMSMGHLGMRVKLNSKDEIGEMALSMDSFADELQNVVIGTMKQISNGDISAHIESKDDQDEISPALKETIESIRSLIVEANMLSQAAVEGRLDTRGNSEAFNGGYKEIVDGVNNTLDAVVGPLNVAAEYVDRISKGDIPPKITDSYNGDFNEIKNNLNTCIDAITALVDDANHLAQAGIAGQLDTRADATRHEGDFAKIVDGVNNTLDAVVGPLNVAAEYVDRISKGDIPPKITDSYNGDFNEIKNNLNTCIDAITALVDDTNHLVQAGIAGQLDTRADATRHEGDFAKIVDGVNNTLDAVVGPLNVAAEYVDRISKGDIPPKITDSYNGDFNEIKNNLNTCIDAITALVDDANHLAQAGIAGQLDTRADATRHEGDFAKIVDGVNNTLDAVVGPLNVAAEYVDRISKGDIPPKITDSYNGDFNEIKNNLNTCIDAITALVDDTNHLVQAGIAGQLDTRADATRHEGDFAKIVDGVNNTLDAVVGPLNVAAEYVDRISKGDIPPKITDSYNGDFNEIKNNLNTCIDAITALVNDANHLAQAGIAGQLDTRADATRHEGDFAKIVDGVNNTLDAVIEPIKEASIALKELANGNLNTYMKGEYFGDHAIIKEDMNQTVKFLKRYVNEITSILEEIGTGNLDQEITDAYLGDFLNIKIAINEITSNLSDTMAEIDEAAEQVEVGSRQISDGGQALSQGTTEQASSIQQINASISEVAEETRKNALNANDANKLAIEVRTNAETGNEQMNEMLGAMVDINDSSKNISKIIKVIDDIAFQTNILALNAAVEAARAGEHGRGFAVVAKEVRSLAAKSAQAAKETTDLIEGSIDKVVIGTGIADQTAISLKEILNEIEKVADLVENIAHASDQQASEIAQITQAINQVSQVVQTNSATAEESAAASEELSSQSEIMMKMVSVFKLKENSKWKNTPRKKSEKREQDVRRSSEPRIILSDLESTAVKVDKY